MLDEVKFAVLAAHFPCVFGQAAMRGGRVKIFEANGGVAENAEEICETVYESLPWVIGEELKSLMVVFPEVVVKSYDQFMMEFTKLLVNMMAYDKEAGYVLPEGVAVNPRSDKFSFPIGGKAWFLPLGYPGHPSSHRRIGEYPFMIINNHAMFDKLKRAHTKSGGTIYESGKSVIHKRLESYHGGVHPLLADFGEDLEYPQYLLPSTELLGRMWEILDQEGGLE